MKSVKYYVGAGCERPIQPAPRSVPAPRSAPPDFRVAPLRFPLRSRSAHMLCTLQCGLLAIAGLLVHFYDRNATHPTERTQEEVTNDMTGICHVIWLRQIRTSSVSFARRVLASVVPTVELECDY